MESDLVLVNDLHEYIIANPTSAHPLRLLLQIYSKHGMITEAVQTAINLLETDKDGLDKETYNSLSPKVRDRLESFGLRRAPEGPHGSNVNASANAYPRSSRSSTARLILNAPARAFPKALPSLPCLGSRRKNSYDEETEHSQSNRGSHCLVSTRQDREKSEDDYDYHSTYHSTQHSRPPPPIQTVADSMAADPPNSLKTAIDDLTSLINYTSSREPSATDDALRSACVTRTDSLASVLHPRYRYLASQALMHTTHESLNHTYANAETMVSMDPISSIPRERFFASEDNYAWDMAELVDALKANPAAALRNPLSRAPFTEQDVAGIIHHPLGRGLAATQVRQSELRRGLRAETIDKLGALARVLLEDEDGMEASREAMDEFAGYTATLPGPEKQALFDLRVPAVDRHTGWGYDASVGEMLRDAKGNAVCGHKAGDFLEQAVGFLRRENRGSDRGSGSGGGRNGIWGKW